MEINSEETNPNPGKRISLPKVFQPVPFLLGGGSESGKSAVQHSVPKCFFAEAHFCEIHRWAGLRPEPPDFPKFPSQ